MSQSFILTRKQVNFPCEKIYENRYLTLPKTLRKRYDLCEREFLIEHLENPLDFKTLWTIQKAIWLRLMTSGLIDKKIVWQDKLIETVNIVCNTSESVIIWTTFLDEYDKVLLCLAAGQIAAEGINGSISVKQRKEILQQFDNGKIKVLVAQPDCYKFGADLSKASCMIYFSQPNSLITKVQTEDRAVHLTKKCPVMIYNMIVKDTIDEDMVNAFSQKKEESARLRRLVNELS
jgi:SNF2 family DNA or RNA helicase